MLDFGFDKQEWTGFCSANVRFHLVWNKGLDKERERERERERGRDREREGKGWLVAMTR